MARAKGQGPIDGFPPATHITIVGTGTDLDGLDNLTLGQAVEVTIKGNVVVIGQELIGDEDSRPVMKIKAVTVTVR